MHANYGRSIRMQLYVNKITPQNNNGVLLSRIKIYCFLFSWS